MFYRRFTGFGGGDIILCTSDHISKDRQSFLQVYVTCIGWMNSIFISPTSMLGNGLPVFVNCLTVLYIVFSHSQIMSIEVLALLYADRCCKIWHI